MGAGSGALGLEVRSWKSGDGWRLVRRSDSHVVRRAPASSQRSQGRGGRDLAEGERGRARSAEVLRYFVRRGCARVRERTREGGQTGGTTGRDVIPAGENAGNDERPRHGSAASSLPGRVIRTPGGARGSGPSPTSNEQTATLRRAEGDGGREGGEGAGARPMARSRGCRLASLSLSLLLRRPSLSLSCRRTHARTWACIMCVRRAHALVCRASCFPPPRHGASVAHTPTPVRAPLQWHSR